MFKRFLLLLVLGVAGIACLYLVAVFEWTYSSGERAGWVQKFSRKGWICKTWEGELAMVSLPGTAPEKFYFTVRDEGVAARLSPSVGQRVRLHYEQHRGLPGTCFGETGYWVDAVTLVEEPSMMPAPGGITAPAAPTPALPATPSTPTPMPAPALPPATSPAPAPAPAPAPG